MPARMIGAFAAAALVATLVPQGAQAQEAGWWDWALRQVVESEDGPRRFPGTEERTSDRDRSRTIGDIILGQRGEERDRKDRTGDRKERVGERGREAPRGKSDARGRGDDRRQGPAFCRSGEGHPVHGRQWCRDKGFGLGSVGAARWEDRRWEDIILRAPRDRDRRSGTIDRGGLVDILGDVIYGRLASEGRRAGAREALTGRWIRPGGLADVLQIRSGSVPVAELSDLDGDGRVDAVLVSRP